ncbi:MAG: hypothetical protein ICV83_03660 [Cytophagales bacterium]|nr:hypothetical protein [Cytophagales bacterium]
MNAMLMRLAGRAGRIGLALLLATATLVGCDQSTPDTEQEKGAIASQRQWEEEKPRHENSYRYTVRFSSAFGFNSTTVVTVTDGNVTGRDFESFTFNGTGTKTVTQRWSETADDLMSHPEGAEAVTLDVIYGRCREQWLTVNTTKNQTHFEKEHNGIISLCGYRRKGCQDDCFQGVTVSAFEWLR